MGCVLRLRKSTVTDEGVQAQHVVDVDADLKDNKFLNDTMMPLLGRNYVYPGNITTIKKEFVVELNELIRPMRPAHRVHLALDSSIGRALFIRDLTLLPRPKFVPNAPLAAPSSCITVEIKPKCGFVPCSKYLSDQTSDIKLHNCRYCMHQQLKLKDGSIHHISSYCPLDLFSGDAERQRRAIRALIECPQNNLKIYKDGQLFYTGTLGGGEKARKDILTLFPDELVASQSHDDTAARLVETVVTILQKEKDVLNNLLKAQQYDDMDIEAIYYLYTLLLQRQQQDTSSLPNNYDDLDRFASLKDITSEEAERHIERYLIATTAKDCSIMIAFAPDGINHQVAVVDLDAKKRASIPSYFTTDRSIVQYFRGSSSGTAHQQCSLGRM
ncbi:hypothetical protein SAMD00019534_078400 [Acytostelium subglobosum LB1]|uniref:hypothetical protein n=1 Tax=Acytostelium subglobosum LB1 TaxID=1410327 RepID=UPI000644C246|nr:hypothetical protein SAMD00019534_078400 [Acytostelium subglobosum LB1]GAM24665.1 hypothetical protein SAMD00019534_078400 [Acytostelium subglobosum LB1]|eukprot:XP_012752334.1 hypothetical protein SAMD00019534_078400 [Acytostelium subglobosum LB1]